MECKSLNDVNKLRQLFYERQGNDAIEFHSKDLHRVKNDDRWLMDFVDNSDYNMNNALNQLWQTMEWRQKFGVNDICEENIRMDYLINSNIYIRGRDMDDKMLLLFKCKLHTRGSKDMNDLKRCLVYWIERAFRESKGEQLTVVFDLLNTGLSHIDLEYTKIIVNTFKNYYPNSLNYILVYEMPWIMNATFQIIKKLLPKKAVERLRFVSAKNIQEYVSVENMPSSWSGGMDTYQYEFIPENRLQMDGHVDGNYQTSNNNNNNIPDQTNLNLSQRKVHFAPQITPESPSLSDLSNCSSFEIRTGDMLHLSPAETIIFQKSNNNEFTGNVEIINVSKKPVTYKIKTTAPDKFRVRPSSGTLSPNNSATINVVIQKNQQIHPLNKDKFLVMCMSLPENDSMTAEEIANMWKEVTANNPDVEQHRLKCTMPANVTTAIINNNNVDGVSDYFSEVPSSNIVQHSSSHNGTRQSTINHQPSQHQLHATINQLTETVHRLETQMKFQQTLQWLSIFVFIMLCIAVIYILKIEIQTQSSQYCVEK